MLKKLCKFHVILVYHPFGHEFAARLSLSIIRVQFIFATPVSICFLDLINTILVDNSVFPRYLVATNVLLKDRNSNFKKFKVDISSKYHSVFYYPTLI